MSARYFTNSQSRRVSRFSRFSIAAAALMALGACAGSNARYVDADTGEYLEFVDDSHVKYVGHFNDREWLYEAERESNGDILAMKMRHPDKAALPEKFGAVRTGSTAVSAHNHDRATARNNAYNSRLQGPIATSRSLRRNRLGFNRWRRSTSGGENGKIR